MNDSSEVKLHFLDYWRVIRLRWGIVLLAFLLVMVTAGVTCYFLPREYFSKVTLEVKPENYRPVDTFGTSGGSGRDPGFVATQFQIIQKTEILYPVIERLRLTEKWASGGPAIPRQAIYIRLLKKMELREVRSTELIDIGVYDTDAQEAADIANTVATVYIEKRKESMADLIKQGLGQLDESVSQQRKAVQEAYSKAAKLRTEHDIIDPDPENPTSQEITLANVTREQQAAGDIKLKVGELTTQLQQIDAAKPEELPVLLDTIQMPNPTVSKVVAQTQEATVERARLLNSGLGENHPKVKALQAQMDVYQRQLKDQLEAVRNALRTKLTIAQNSKQDIETKFVASQKEFTDKKNLSANYYEAKNNYLAQKKLLESAQQQFNVESMKIRVSTVPAQIHERAERALGWSRPNIAGYMSLASVIGIIIGTSLAFFIEYLDTSVKTLDDVERYLKIPVLAVIPKNVGVLHRQPVDSPDAEAYRILRTNIEFNRKNPDSNTITIVSGGAGEGKSTTLCNLAYTCAKGGYNVLIIDADLRRPSLHKLFDMDNSVGLTNYLTSKMDFSEVVRPTKIENLSFIPSGILPSDAVGILNSQRMVDLIATVKRKYDLVFLDSPPILGVSDASILASEVDITVMVVQHRRFPRSMLQRVKQAVISVGGNLLGVVLNNVDTKQDSSYQYYTSYYDYYTPQKEEKGKPNPRLEPVKIPAARTRPGQSADY